MTTAPSVLLLRTLATLLSTPTDSIHITQLAAQMHMERGELIDLVTRGCRGGYVDLVNLRVEMTEKGWAWVAWDRERNRH